MPLKCASGRLFNNWYTYRNYWRVCSIDRVCPRRMHTDNFDPRLRSYLMKTKLELIDRSTHQETNKDSREIQHHELHMLGQLADRLSLCEEEFRELKNMAKDDDVDLRVMVEEESRLLLEKLAEIQEQAVEMILPGNNVPINGIIMELTGGIGGLEAMLFCKELLDMYCNYCENQGWDHYVDNCEKSSLGGVRRAWLNIDYPEAFDRLKFEGGVHRVQRVPKTEKFGRLQTSTVSVAVLPKPSEVIISIDPKDLKIDTYRAGGAGGQHVNTTDSAVRVTHIPSGLAVESQSQRSQAMNRQQAIATIRTRLFQLEVDRQLSTTHSSRKLQIGSKSRSEKIRTYNFLQDRITDHRINFSVHNLAEFMNGADQMETMIDHLVQESRRERLDEFLAKLGH